MRFKLTIVYAFLIFFTVLFCALQFTSFSRDIEARNHRLRLPKPRCSFELFKNVASERTEGHVSGQGYWNRDPNGYLERFNPAVCRLSYGMWIPSERISACLKDNTWLRHITIIGDSNARRYTRLLHKVFAGPETTNNSMNCSEIHIHQRISYDSYSLPTVLVKRRCGCGGLCSVEARHTNRYINEAECRVVDGSIGTKSLVIEHVPLFFWGMNDPDVVYGCSKSSTGPVVTSNRTMSNQEFLFAEYLTNPRPDVIILVANMHDGYPLTNTSFVEHQLDLLDRHVASTTRVVIIPLHLPALHRMPPKWANKMYQDGSGKPVLRDEWVRQFNKIIFRLAKKRFIDGRNVHIIPDMAEVSRDVPDVNLDGVHMRDDWYQNIMSAVVQHLCDM